MSMQPLGIWSPHRDSPCVQAYKALLGLRSESWMWVNTPEEARWIVVDASREVDEHVHLLTKAQPRQRYGIALANAWSELPHKHWVFFKVPLTPKSLFPWIDQILGLHIDLYRDTENGRDQTSLHTGKWNGRLLKLRHWPNLTAYPGMPPMMMVACRQMLTGGMRYELLLQAVGNEALLARLLDDALQQGNLSAEEARALPGHPVADGDGNVEDKTPGLFRLFLDRFR
jgi:hypothetical protein